VLNSVHPAVDDCWRNQLSANTQVRHLLHASSRSHHDDVFSSSIYSRYSIPGWRCRPNQLSRYVGLAGVLKLHTHTAELDLVLWSILECNLGLNITCLPSLRPYFTRGGEPSPRNSGRGHSGPKVTDRIRTIGRIRSRKQRNLSLGPRESLGATLGGTMAGTLAGTEEELTWNEGKQSHRSQNSDADMELVQSKPVVVEDIA
jgi:hypothetical protein